MAHHRYTIVDELRHATRFGRDRGTDVAVLWAEQGKEMLVDVHDESIGGLGLYLDDVEDFPVGREVHIIYLDQYMLAHVRHIELQPEGGYIVGFACDRTEA